jgi:dihydrolipoamide dehydrogenase
MPSKLLIAAAEAAHSAAHARDFGVYIDGALRIDGVQVMDRVRRERDRFVGFVLQSIEEIPSADKVRGYARFVSNTVLNVDDHTEIHARRVVIASGSTPVVPESYRGLGDRVVVNDDVFAWRDLPQRVMVVGAGVVGLELGQALSRLGVDVRVLSRSGGVAGLSDPVVKAAAKGVFEAEFSLLLNAEILDAKRIGDEVEVRYRDAAKHETTERFDYLLVATGRAPNIERLALENTEAVLDDKGMPEFDPGTLQVGSTPIFFAGDVNAHFPVLHVAADDGRIAGQNAAGYPDVMAPARSALLAIVFTDPQIAQMGMRYKDLPEQGIAIGEVDFSDQGRSRVMLKNYGKLRVYCAKRDGKFLGAEMAGPSAEHVSHLLAWAAQQELTVDQMLAMPFYHPVIEEGVRTALREAACQVAAHRHSSNESYVLTHLD